MNGLITIIGNEIKSHFAENLYSLLLYGSSSTTHESWDVDIAIILFKKENPIDDLSFLRTLMRKYGEESLDLQLLYEVEIKSADLFSLDAHGAFFNEILSQATVLYGQNPFAGVRPREDIRVISLINRIQRYIFQSRQEYIGIERHNKDKNPHYHCKHLKRCIFDLVLLTHQCKSVHEALHHFKIEHGSVFTDEDWRVIQDATEPDSVDRFLTLYEKVYDRALALTKTLFPSTRFKILRENYRGIVYEYICPPDSHKALILIDGLPRKPELSDTMNLLASWGYAVFFPRLKGTWESAGNFLDHEPTTDIVAFAQYLREGNQHSKWSSIMALGTSFGGLVAMDASRDESIDKAIALSPVVSFNETSNIGSLSEYINKVFPSAYRYSAENWNRLITDQVISLSKSVGSDKFRPNKCHVVLGECDESFNIQRNFSALTRANIPVTVIKASHLTLHKDLSSTMPILWSLLNRI